MLTTDQKGAVAELAIACAAADLGIGVWSSYTVERYDLIFDLRPQLVRVQCKWACRYGDVERGTHRTKSTPSLLIAPN